MLNYTDFDGIASSWPGVKRNNLGVVRSPRNGLIGQS